MCPVSLVSTCVACVPCLVSACLLCPPVPCFPLCPLCPVVSPVSPCVHCVPLCPLCLLYGMVWYGMVINFYLYTYRYIYIKYRKTNYLTNLESTIKTKIIKMKRKQLLFKQAVCKNSISLIKLFVNRNLGLLIFC